MDELQELKELKRKWYAEARSLGHLWAIAQVGRHLGEKSTDTCGPKFCWQKNAVEIFVDDYGGYLTVYWNGKLVCSTHSTNELYVPGPWMDIVSEAHPQATKIWTDRQAQTVCAEAKRLQEELALPK